jgi:nitrite reductase/ring-hydroxylating ferredoxin subunit
VPASAPVRLQLPRLGVDASIVGRNSRYHADTGVWDPITPPEDSLHDLEHVVAWWRQRPEPAVPSTGTTYLYGHNCPHVDCVFNRLDELRIGDRIVLTTASAAFDFRVTSDARHNVTSKNSGDNNATVNSALYRTYRVPNRLVLFTCGYVGPAGSTYSPINEAVVATVYWVSPHHRA